ncbi:hypothetical protein VC83_02534 [Pseudogymnoascus destructans]|uniref:FAD-binding domain-containing protein n=1 Tax=Pseudogymnoascus destructans TaxID=655981 RepID=A0A177AIA9_9PEZI|nr:uncharacterized protein VC83_02534 [Pseudogymnoascus destructans]OAF61192.1 hypothetical protein VC83_02534 [Pseudogymnoascus destructans]
MLRLSKLRKLAETGAGIQVTPNSSTLLKRWGLRVLLEFRSEAKEQNYADSLKKKYGSDTLNISRVDVQKGLYDRAKDLGVEFHFGTKVVEIDMDDGRVNSAAGQEFKGDLVIGADGIWSRLARFLDHVKVVETWKLMHRQEVETWINDKGNFVLIGDASHPMIPYLAQGANSAIEDGATIGLTLGKITSKLQLPQALQMFQAMRKARGEAIESSPFV